MSTLSEIEAAADALPADQKQQLLLYLAERLRSEGSHTPEPRDLSNGQIVSWIADDEADMRRFREAQ